MNEMIIYGYCAVIFFITGVIANRALTIYAKKQKAKRENEKV